MDQPLTRVLGEEESYEAEAAAPVDPKFVPRKLEVLHAAWVWTFASITLTLEFVMIALGCIDPTSPNIQFAPAVNAVGLVSCVTWLYGFFMLAHWLISITPGGAPAAFKSVGFYGCVLKIAASVFFNMQPLSGLLMLNEGGGFTWTNLVGIALFHSGNLVNLVDMFIININKPGGYMSAKPFSHVNIPVWAMVVFGIATTFLVTSNALEFANAHFSGVGTVESVCNVLGGSLLTLGSVVRCLFKSRFVWICDADIPKRSSLLSLTFCSHICLPLHTHTHTHSTHR